MSLIIRRKANGLGVAIGEGENVCMVRVSSVDPDGTVHLVFNADRSVRILREELTPQYKHQTRLKYNRSDYVGDDNG